MGSIPSQDGACHLKVHGKIDLRNSIVAGVVRARVVVFKVIVRKIFGHQSLHFVHLIVLREIAFIRVQVLKCQVHRVIVQCEVSVRGRESAECNTFCLEHMVLTVAGKGTLLQAEVAKLSLSMKDLIFQIHCEV